MDQTLSPCMFCQRPTRHQCMPGAACCRWCGYRFSQLGILRLSEPVVIGYPIRQFKWKPLDYDTVPVPTVKLRAI